ncbi:hypothetical protein, partial [Nocardia farcinica]|uniref:hypothetical protein n=1 Tax=Nocardia farcinica TaxID=37329 RepID=UPI00245894B6
MTDKNQLHPFTVPHGEAGVRVGLGRGGRHATGHRFGGRTCDRGGGGGAPRAPRPFSACASRPPKAAHHTAHGGAPGSPITVSASAIASSWRFSFTAHAEA